MPPKKIPMRMCVGCREMKEKKQLVRVVLQPEGAGGGIRLDFKGKMNGRGAYVCKSRACVERAGKSRAIERALGSAVPEEVFEELLKISAESGGPEDGDNSHGGVIVEFNR